MCVIGEGETGSGEAIGGDDESFGDAGLADGVAGVRHDDQLCFRPGAMEVPGALDRADDIVAALDDDARDVADAVDLFEELAWADIRGVWKRPLAPSIRNGILPFLRKREKASAKLSAPNDSISEGSNWRREVLASQVLQARAASSMTLRSGEVRRRW